MFSGVLWLGAPRLEQKLLFYVVVTSATVRLGFTLVSVRLPILIAIVASLALVSLVVVFLCDSDALRQHALHARCAAVSALVKWHVLVVQSVGGEVRSRGHGGVLAWAWRFVNCRLAIQNTSHRKGGLLFVPRC